MKALLLSSGLFAAALTSCPWPNPNPNPNPGTNLGTTPDPTPTRPNRPVKPPVTLAPKPIVLPNDARLYHFNPLLTPNVHFLLPGGSLPAGSRYDTGQKILPVSKVKKLTASLNSHEPPSPVFFRPQEAVVYFDSNKKPVYCVEISATTGIVRGMDPATGKSIQLTDKKAAFEVLHEH